METMPLALDWTGIAARLACAFAAGAAFGVNRSESGKAAGLRTTILVGLAACSRCCKPMRCSTKRARLATGSPHSMSCGFRSAS